MTERTGRSANAARSDKTLELPASLGETDFGRVDPEQLPDPMPQAGKTVLTYDDEMRLTRIRDAAGESVTIGYDAAGRASTRQWPFRGDDPGTQQQDPVPITLRYGYDRHGNLVSAVDGEGSETRFTFDGYDREREIDAPGAGRAPEAAVETRELTRVGYDLNGNLRSRETPRGTATSVADDFTHEYEYDSLDQLVLERNPTSEAWNYEYDVSGNRTAATSPRGESLTAPERDLYTTTSSYDDSDQLISETRKVLDGTSTLTLTTSYSYDDDGNPTKSIGPGAAMLPGGADVTRESSTVYDGRGLPWKVGVGKDAELRTTLFEYDANGNLRRTVKPRGVNASGDAVTGDDGADAAGTDLSALAKNATVQQFDEHDLLVRRYLPWDDDDTRKFRQELVRDPAPEEPNPLRRVSSLLSPHVLNDETVARTSYTYFANGWFKSVSDQKITDPVSNKAIESRLVDYDYDRRGAQTEWRSKNAGETAAGRHIKRTFWSSGALRSRLAKKTSDADTTTSRRYEYYYDENGSLSNFVDVDKARRTKISHDAADRQSLVNEVWSTGKDTVFDYDANGNAITRRTDGTIGGGADGGYGGDDAKVTAFTYDSLDRETRMVVDPTLGVDRTTTTSYHPSGEREERVKPNRTQDRWYFNSRGERSHFERWRRDSTSPARSVAYTYDANSNRTTDERGTHTFNARDQLASWTKPGGSYTTYELNGDGATTTKVIRSSVGGPVTKQVDFVYRGERLRYADDAVVRSVYHYDDFGNVVRISAQSKIGGVFLDPGDGATEPRSTECADVPADTPATDSYFCYDEFERLRLSRGQGIDKHEKINYDGLDRRDSTEVGGTIRDHSYVGTSELLSRQVEGDGTRRFYDYDADGERQGQASGGIAPSYRSYTFDANGSVLGLEDAEGNVATNEAYSYDPYGALEQDESALSPDAKANPFRFEGFYYDAGIKSYDMFARHYEPEVGRFLTQDRFASAAGDWALQSDVVTQNRYAFAGGNPVNRIEFDGHEPPSSYNRNARQTMRDKEGKCYRDCKPRRGPAQSNSGPDPYYQRGSVDENGNSDAESVGSYGSTTRPSDYQGQSNWHRKPTAYACQACPSPAALAKRIPSDGGAIGGAKAAASDTWHAATHPRQTANGLWWAAHNPGEAASAIANTCDNHSAGFCAAYIGTQLAGAKGGTSVLRAGARVAKGASEAERGGLNLFKWRDPTSTTAAGWREGDRMLTVPWKGSPKATWRENASRLRHEMRSGEPIYETYVDRAGNLIPTKGFLNAERNLLTNRGWQYTSRMRAWTPPR